MKTCAIDIGASSGRIIVSEWDGKNFRSEETFRFPNGMKEESGHLRWDFSALFENILKGLKVTFEKEKNIQTIGIDTWAVDYGLLDKKGKLIENPIGYRDARCLASMNRLLEDLDYSEIYTESGIQKLPFNTIFQLFDDIENKKKFSGFLLIPDLIAYELTGKRRCELTNLSTTAFYNPVKRTLSENNLRHIGLNKTAFAPMVLPGEKIGSLKKELIEKYDLYPCEVVAVGSHDTASAVAGAPIEEGSAYLSSGTWSLLGVELKEPLITKETYEANFTNEIGLDHSVRFLKNIMGLFIIQEIRHDIEASGEKISFQKIMDQAEAVKDNSVYIDVNDILFSTPGDMLNKYYLYLKKTGQYTKELSVGEIARSVYESMALTYIDEFKTLEELTGKKYDSLTVIGGGAKAHLLNQLISEALNLEVRTGPSEATALGNTLAQLIYLGAYKDHYQARSLLPLTYKKEVYTPKEPQKMQKKYQDYLKKTKGGC